MPTRPRAKRSKPAPKPPPNVVSTVAELAKRLHVHERTVKRWLKDGCPGRHGQYDVDAVTAWCDANLGERRKATARDRAYWEMRRSRAAAQIADLRLAERRGELVGAEAARRAFIPAITTIKTHLEQMPDFVLSLHAFPGEAAKRVRARVHQKITDLLTELQAQAKAAAAAIVKDHDDDETDD